MFDFPSLFDKVDVTPIFKRILKDRRNGAQVAEITSIEFADIQLYLLKIQSPRDDIIAIMDLPLKVVAKVS